MARSPLRSLVRFAVVALALVPLAVGAQAPGPRPVDPANQPAAAGGTVAGPLPAPAKPGSPMLSLTWEEESVQAGVSVGLTVQALDGDGNADAGPAGTVTLFLGDEFAVVSGGQGGALDTVPVAGGRQAELALAGGTAGARVRFSRPGQHVVRAQLTGAVDLAGESDPLTVKSTLLRIEGPSSTDVGKRERYTVTARDEDGQPVADYEGTLVVTTVGGVEQETGSRQSGAGAAGAGQGQQGPSPTPTPSGSPRPSASPSPSASAARPSGDPNALVAVVGGGQQVQGASAAPGEAVQQLGRGGGGRVELDVTFSTGGARALSVRDLSAPTQRATLPLNVSDPTPSPSPTPTPSGSPSPSASPSPSPSAAPSPPPFPSPSPPPPPRPFGGSTGASPSPSTAPTPTPSGTPAPGPTATATPPPSATPTPAPASAATPIAMPAPSASLMPAPVPAGSATPAGAPDAAGAGEARAPVDATETAEPADDALPTPESEATPTPTPTPSAGRSDGRTVVGALTSLQTPPCTGVSVTPSPASPQAVGASVTFTASATGCPSPQYQFWLYTPGSGWAMVRDWNSAASYQKLNFSPAGLYYVYVYARQSGATTDQAETQISYTITSTTGCTSASLSLDAFPPVSAGTVVTATATASGCTSPLYRFWRLDPGGAWTMVQDYSATATYTWNTTGVADGQYYLGVWMKQSGSTVDPERTATASLQIGQPTGAQSIFSFSPTVILQSNVGVPVQITVKALLNPGGAINTNYRGTVRLTSSDPLMTPGPLDTYTFTAADNGQHVFTITFNTASTSVGTMRVTDVADTSKTGSAGYLAVKETVLTASFSGGSVQQGSPINLTVQAHDSTAGGAVLTGYRGTVQLSASNDSVMEWGGGTNLSGRYTFTGADNGQKTFSPTFLYAGSQTATVTDTANPARTVTTSALSVTSAPVSPVFQSGDSSPTGVTLTDGSLLWAYLSSRGTLYARRNVGTLGEPAWRSLVTVREAAAGGTGASSPSLALLGSTLALFHTYTDGTYQQVWVTTSTDNGATWSTPTKLTNETTHVQRVRAVVVGSTLYLFWSRHDTGGQVSYQTTTNLTNWTATQTLSQTIGASTSNTTSNFGITKLASGPWLLGWVGASNVGEAPNVSPGDLAHPVVKVATSADLTSWSPPQELTQAFSQRWPKSVALGQESGGTIRALFEQYAAPSDTYIAQRTSTTGTSWAAQTLVGFDRSATANGQQHYHAAMPTLVTGTATCGWSAEVWPPSGGTGLQSYGRGSWTDANAGEGVSLLDCGTPAEVLPVPYGEMPQTATGTLLTGEGTGGGVDLSVPALGGSLTVARAYRSFDGITGKNGPFGYGWHWSYGVKAVKHADDSVTIIDGSGRRLLFTKDGSGWTAGPATNATLTAGGSGGWVLTTHSQSVFTFDSSGKLTTITDRNGSTHTLTYAGANLSSIAAPGGRTLTVTTSSGRITRIDAPGGLYSAYTYDGNGNLETARDASGSVTTYAYDSRHQLTSVNDPNGNRAVETTYGTLGRVKSQSFGRPATGGGSFGSPQGGTTSIVYPPQGYAGNWGGLTTVTDPRGNQRRAANDAAWRTLQADAYEGSTKILQRATFVYNANGDVTSSTDPNGRVSSATYDGRGNALTATTDAGGLNIQSSFTYSSTNDVLTATNGMNQTVTNTYDTRGNLLTVTNPLNQTTTFTYSSVGQVLTETNPTGQVTTHTYNAAGFRTSTTARGVTVDFVYDAAGRQTESSSTPSGNPKLTLGTATYDGMGRVLTAANGLGHTTTTTYDANGNILTITDPLTHTTTSTYDAMNRLVTVTDALSPAGVTSYTYDANGNLTERTNALNKSWTTTYDALNRPSQSTDPLSRTGFVAYDPAGNPIRVTKPDGLTLGYVYDGVDRLTRVHGAFGAVEYAYDAAGRRTRMTDSTGTTQYVYDAAGQLTSAAAPLSGTVQYGYDASGRRTSLTYPSGRVVTYSYASGANGGNLTEISTTSPSVSASYSYDVYGRLDQATTGAGDFTTYGYDSASRLAEIKHKESGGTVFQQALYTLDAAGNRTQFTDSAGTMSYTYDAINQLLSETRGGTTTSYTYDKVGNRLTQTVGGSTTTYTYDAANQLTAAGSTTFSFDANGNQTSKDATTYNWDALNRLTSISSGSSASYTYNGDGLRVQRTGGSTTTTFAWDLSQDVPQLLSDGNDYVYGSTGLLAVIAAGGSCAAYAFTDGLGSIQARRTAGGTPVTQQYDAFGQPLTAPPNPCTTVALGFAGEQQDQDSGLVYLRARYMDPSTGRFLSRDPLGADRNGYSYAANNPVNAQDPSGLAPNFYCYWNSCGDSRPFVLNNARLQQPRKEFRQDWGVVFISVYYVDEEDQTGPSRLLIYYDIHLRNRSEIITGAMVAFHIYANDDGSRDINNFVGIVNAPRSEVNLREQTISGVASTAEGGPRISQGNTYSVYYTGVIFTNEFTPGVGPGGGVGIGISRNRHICPEENPCGPVVIDTTPPDLRYITSLP